LCSFNYIYREVQLRDGREESETAQSERERERKRAKTFWGKSGKKIRGKRGQPPLQGVCVHAHIVLGQFTLFPSYYTTKASMSLRKCPHYCNNMEPLRAPNSHTHKLVSVMEPLVRLITPSRAVLTD
jgi:hypothetical protein